MPYTPKREDPRVKLRVEVSLVGNKEDFYSMYEFFTHVVTSALKIIPVTGDIVWVEWEERRVRVMLGDTADFLAERWIKKWGR